MTTISVTSTMISTVESHLSDFYGTSIKDLGKLTGLSEAAITASIESLQASGKVRPVGPHGRYRLTADSDTLRVI